ncbi:hypothetical protein CTAM01_08813 [Colletotrichum tamarilloi]|uniref:Secreted protein n=1 Tax=Colletotrichum tamarilloi TaxID=1209934 RepID=A0ABQ9R501_9PEZI|nr:uncharacterized protein CTAM01_08813 [Colletotrichum tamarilloi]KAK1494800.1 hypothetical protein CTAM01_08813 [Colletotrichum tamarilloi]
MIGGYMSPCSSRMPLYPFFFVLFTLQNSVRATLTTVPSLYISLKTGGRLNNPSRLECGPLISTPSRGHVLDV